MTKFDKIFSVAVIGIISPVFFMLLFWWGSIPFLKSNEQLIMVLALSGLMLGLILDLTLLRRFLYKLFDLPLTVLAAVYIFYSILIYGFFMGFPVFNSILGIAGSYIVARKCMKQNMSRDDTRNNIKYIIRLSTITLFFFCFGTAVLALNENSICSQVKGMLNLSFDVTIGMIWGLILAGGSALLLFQYYISKVLAAKVIRLQ